MKHLLRTPYWQLKLPTAINGLMRGSLLMRVSEIRLCCEGELVVKEDRE